MIWLHFTIGRGPNECEKGLLLLMNAVQQEALSKNLVCEVVDVEPSDYGATSALLNISGDDESSFAQSWTGTIEWVWKSTLRNHGRKRWFMGISSFSNEETSFQINESDLRWETMRASGPGGQYVNKTDSAVRLTHMPSGIVVKAQEERSQHRNKSLALAKLTAQLKARQDQKSADDSKAVWDNHNNLERGNPIRTFKGLNFVESMRK